MGEIGDAQGRGDLIGRQMAMEFRWIWRVGGIEYCLLFNERELANQKFESRLALVNLFSISLGNS
jgi:hypothetical protein